MYQMLKTEQWAKVRPCKHHRIGTWSVCCPSGLGFLLWGRAFDQIIVSVTGSGQGLYCMNCGAVLKQAEGSILCCSVITEKTLLGHWEASCSGGLVYFLGGASVFSDWNESNNNSPGNIGWEQEGYRWTWRRWTLGFPPKSEMWHQDNQVSPHQAASVQEKHAAEPRAKSPLSLAQGSFSLQLNCIHHLIPPVQMWHDLLMAWLALTLNWDILIHI